MAITGKPRVAVVAVVSLALVATAVIAVVAWPDGQRTRLVLGSSTQQQTLDVLTGSDSTLVYARLPRRALEMSSGGAASYNAEIVARDRPGHERLLGTLNQPRFDWSLVGKLLTADEGGGAAHAVDWWNVATAAAGHLNLPADLYYLSAAPGGVLAARPDGQVDIVSLSGHRMLLGRPFEHSAVNSAASDSHGAVLGGEHGEAAYLRFSAPSRFQSLSTGTRLPLTCQSVTQIYAACLGGTTEDHVNLTRSLLLPLDGGEPTSVAAHPTSAAISGDSLVWLDMPSYPSVKVASLTVGSDRPSMHDAPLLRLTTAYGEGVGLSADRRSLVSVDGSGRLVTLLSAPAAPITYSSFVISDGHIITIDDAAEPDHPDSELSVHSWPLTAAGTLDRTSHPVLIGTGSHQHPIVPSMLAACGRSVAYVTTDQSSYGVLHSTLHIVTPSATTVVDDVLRGGLLECSGSKLLYTRWSTEPQLPAGPLQVELRIHDMDTGSDTFLANVVEARASDGSDLPDGVTHVAALSGHWAVYVEPYGAVIRVDLRTGVKTTVTSFPLFHKPGSVNVYLAGRRLLWHFHNSFGHPPHDISALVTFNRNTITRTTPIPEAAVALTPDGVITQQEVSNPNVPTPLPRSYSLRLWSGAVRRLLPESVYWSNPRVVGNTLAWIDQNDVLQTRGY